MEAALGHGMPDGCVITGWVAIYTYMNDSGDQLIGLDCPPSALTSTNLGLIAWADARIRADVKGEW